MSGEETNRKQKLTSCVRGDTDAVAQVSVVRSELSCSYPLLSSASSLAGG
uniref:Uncharacterized protein n=1 Tax=Anguilla anguilla TaxID=7936 RepID=A0A0E9UNU5_ANGAN